MLTFYVNQCMILNVTIVNTSPRRLPGEHRMIKYFSDSKEAEEYLKTVKEAIQNCMDATAFNVVWGVLENMYMQIRVYFPDFLKEANVTDYIFVNHEEDFKTLRSRFSVINEQLNLFDINAYVCFETPDTCEKNSIIFFVRDPSLLMK